MLDATTSGCINHPGIEAITRCKQCSRPVCGACVETSALGAFCSATCREKYQAFVQRAQNLDTTVRYSKFQWLKMLIGRTLILAFLLVMIGLIATRFHIPFVTEATGWVRDTLGL